MDAQTVQDIIVIAGMFVLRIGLPLMLILGAGYLSQRKRGTACYPLVPRQTEPGKESSNPSLRPLEQQA